MPSMIDWVVHMGAHTSTESDVKAVLDSIRRIVQGLHESSRDAQRQIGLTSAQLFVLSRLADGGPMSVNDVAQRTFTHQSSVSTVVSRLESKRLVQRGVDPADGRRRILTLTRAGRAALAAAPMTAQEHLIRAVRRLTPATRRIVARALGEMSNAMAVARRPAMFFETGGRHA
jgi:DNA-binding MarR family transcriptional regulator